MAPIEHQSNAGIHHEKRLNNSRREFTLVELLVVVASIDGAEVSSLATAFGAPITAPLAVADGRVFVGCEDGYLYIFGAGGKAPLPKRIRKSGRFAARSLGRWLARNSTGTRTTATSAVPTPMTRD